VLTSRGWWFLLFVLTLLVIGALLVLNPNGPATALVAGLALALWFGWEWALFARQARFAARQVGIERELGDERGPITALWAGRPFTVRLRARLGGSIPLTVAFLTDRPPVGAELFGGAPDVAGAIPAGGEVGWEYRLLCPAPGSLRFEGCRLRIADRQGFFYFETFVRGPKAYPVLPKLVGAKAEQRADKRFNLLPPPGVHRHRRPGSGSELLDLRDYRPGDPPRWIAWKASARRDRLITREFESEVPLRCTLFVDTSDSVRLGPPGQNALAGLVQVSAAVAQAASANHDLVGLALCDEHHTEYVAPARTRVHTVELLRRLAVRANVAPATEAADVDPLTDKAWATAAQLYPDLLEPAINHFPAWLPWLSPPPGWARRHPTWRDRLLARPRMWLYRHRRRYARRKRLAALFALRHGLPAGGLGQLLEDDAAFAAHAQRFLAEHRMSFDVPLYDARGRYLFARPAKVEVLAKALTRAVGRGRDNELFVILADLMELDAHLMPLLKAVRVARARHHQVLLVCPWPSGLAAPDGPEPPALPHEDATVAELVRLATRQRLYRAWRGVRQAFGRLGVPVVNAASGDPARLILHRLEELRSIQGATRG
jgi:uncharacterized protein (DUF58 family)